MTAPFLNPGHLQDGELELRVRKLMPANPAKAYVPAYDFGMYVGEAEVGHLNFRIADTPLLLLVGGHIGYAVNEEHRGKRYAERACRLVFPLAKQHGLQRLIITCLPNNRASYRTIENLGGKFLGIVNVPTTHEMWREDADNRRRRYQVTLT
ncbi:MAG: GNAT family N-acetyltransferase [Proteobacteria bacterium]|nr:GNAT family N-acetyltransferase [Pseudomonadota bacterium]NBX86201.1 GNAT family N-acetyltransferase [Pseudomonadota bacterium]